MDETEVGYTASDGSNCGWDFSVGQHVTVFATGSPKTGFSTDRCMMIPYTSYTGRGDNRFAAALELYRARREAFAADLRREGPNEQTLQLQAAFFATYKDLDDADLAYSNLLQLKRNDAKALVGRGSVRYAAERFADALADYDAAIVADAANADARRGRTLSLVKLRRMRELTADDRDFSGINSAWDQRVSFVGADLVGAKFRGATLNQVDFSQARLAGADFSAATVQKADFKGADLRGAILTGMRSYSSDFSSANLANSNLAKANFHLGKFDRADLSGANLTGATFEGASLVHANLAGAQLDGTNLYKADLSGTDLAGMDLSKLDMQGVRLRNTTLMNANLSGAYLSGPSRYGRGNESLHGVGRPPDLRGTELTGAKLDGADLRFALFDCMTRWPRGFDPTAYLLMPVTSALCPGPPLKTKLFERPGELREMPGKFGGERAKVRGAEIEKEDLSGADLSKANLSGFRMWSVTLRGAKLMDTDFRNATLIGSDLTGADLTGADLSGADLGSVDFSGARLANAKFSGATYSDRTIWPEGFDVASAGMTFHAPRR